MLKKATLFIILLLSTFVSTSAQEFENSKIGVTLNNFGRIRIHAPMIESTRQMDRISVLAGFENQQVFDFWDSVATVDTSMLVENPLSSDYELYVKIENSDVGIPYDFQYSINAYGWNDGAFALLKYQFINKQPDNPEITPGLEILPQIDGNYGAEQTGFNSNNNTLDIQASVFSTKVKIRLLNDDAYSFSAIDWEDGYFDGDTTLWAMISSGNTIDQYTSGPDGSVSVLGLAPRAMAVDEIVEMWLAVSVGATDSDANSALNAAVEKYQLLTEVSQTDNLLPQDYNLGQNYPNPFNPTTTIQFSIPEKTNVKLLLYNSIGEKVQELLEEEMSPGNYQTKLNGEGLTSGIYFYTLITDNYITTKKMILLK